MHTMLATLADRWFGVEFHRQRRGMPMARRLATTLSFCARIARIDTDFCRTTRSGRSREEPASLARCSTRGQFQPKIPGLRSRRRAPMARRPACRLLLDLAERQVAEARYGICNGAVADCIRHGAEHMRTPAVISAGLVGTGKIG